MCNNYQNNFQVINMNDRYNVITNTQFGKNVKQRRKELGYSQQELSEKLGISSNQLSSIETGKSKTSFEGLAKLCECLDVTPDYLMLGCMHSKNIYKNLEDLIRSMSTPQQLLLYQIGLIIKENKIKED